MTADILARFRAKFKVNPETGCWEWTASKTTSGYGHVRFVGRLCQAHRVSWEINRGPIPEGLFVLHKCDVRHCVNPDHLFLGTSADNMRDMVAKCRHVEGNNRSAEKRRGRPVSPEARARLLAASLGRKVSPETRARISAALKGRPGKPHSEEAKAKMSAAAKARKGRPGRPQSPETRAKLSALAMARYAAKRKAEASGAVASGGGS